MSFLLLSIFFNALIFIFFKWLGRINTNVFLVVVFNYFFAGVAGLLLYGQFAVSALISMSWFYPALILGGAFVFVFYLMATTTKEAGASRAVIANKISLIIPVITAFYLYNDTFGWFKILGLICTIIGLVLMVSGKTDYATARSGFLVILLFVVSGFMDASLKYIQYFWLDFEHNMLFTAVLFLGAFITGLASLPFMKFEYQFNDIMRDMRLGLVLGLVNVGSIFFLITALQLPSFESSVIFPLNNIGVILLSTLAAVILLGEKLTGRNYIGLVISVFALFLLFLSNFNQS